LNKALVFLILAAVLMAVPYAGAENKPKKADTAKFLIRNVYAKKADKEKIPDELKDIAAALRSATTNNVFTLNNSVSIDATIGKKASTDLGAQKLSLEFEGSKCVDSTLTGNLNILQKKDDKTTSLLKADIEIKVGATLCVSLGNFDGQELIVAITLKEMK